MTLPPGITVYTPDQVQSIIKAELSKGLAAKDAEVGRAEEALRTLKASVDTAIAEAVKEQNAEIERLKAMVLFLKEEAHEYIVRVERGPR